MLEEGESYGVELSVNSLGFSFPSESWNLTSLELNFTDITFHREIVEVESEVLLSAPKRLNKGTTGYAVQINITETIEIYSVHLYGREVNPATTTNITVQINGYDSLLDEPNATIYGSEELNMSSSFGWYVQTFSAPILLNEGNYTLILNGTDMLPSDSASYYWNFNEEAPSNPNLFSWEYKGGWETGITGEPFLYKLDQRITSEFFPENHNMTAEIGQNYYTISNGPSPGTGSLNITETFSPHDTQLSIPIINNKSSAIFNVTHAFSARNYLSSEGLLTIQEGIENEWKLTPNIQRFYNNYSVKFEYPLQWENLIVKRNDVDISSSVYINTTNKIILLHNNTITDGATWEIIANSPNVGITLNVPKTTFQPEQVLAFSLLPPINPGNLTYILMNSLGFKEYNETMEITQITSEEIVLSYILSSNPNEGIYKAYIYWYDNENAGITTQEFQVNVPFVLDPIFILIIVVGSVLISAVSFTSYKLVKRSRKIREEYRLKIYNKYMDVSNLDYFIIIEKRTGLPIYEQILASKNIGASLITGFLEAIRTFGIELTGANEQSQTIKLEYRQSKIIMSEFKNFRILLIMKENPSQDFLDSIKALSYEIDTTYGDQIVNFTGNISNFKDVGELLDKHLETSLIYPLYLETQNIKVNSEEKSLISRAINIMEKKNTNYFFVSHLLSTKKGFQVKDAETILKLIDKKIFQPKV
ncbi:MAG: hypothetical protein ACXAC5_24615 [Promethearchaeota archaeon]